MQCDDGHDSGTGRIGLRLTALTAALYKTIKINMNRQDTREKYKLDLAGTQCMTIHRFACGYIGL